MAEGASEGKTVITPAPQRRPRPRGLLRLFRRDQRGQALVEFALVFLPLCLIIIGGIDFGFVLKNVISARQGVSDAAREASVGQFGTTSSCGLSSPGGNTLTQDMMCYTHSQMGLDSTQTRVAVYVGDSATSPSDKDQYLGPGQTGASGQTGPQPITICVQYQLHSITGILPFINGTVTTSTATDMTEVSNLIPGQSPAQTPTSGTEASFSGGSWPSACINGPAPA